MRANIDAYVQKCEVCQRTKTSRHRFYNELVSLLVFTRFWVEIFMNFITKLLANRHENDVYDAILVIIDKYTKMFLYILVKSIWSIEDLIDIFFEKVFLYFENVKSIVSNKNNLFTSDFWSTLCYRTRIKRKLNIAFHSQIDKQIERQNQTLKHYLRCYCNYKQDNWDFFLSLTQFVYNCVKYASIEFNSFEVAFDYQLDFNFNWDDKNCFDVSIVKERVQRLWDDRDLLMKRLKRARRAQTHSHNKKTKFKNF